MQYRFPVFWFLEFDYSGPSNGGFTEATANDQNCIMFPILEDSFIEGTEVFNITVTSTDLVKEGSSAIIYIEDNDGKIGICVDLSTLLLFSFPP